MTPLLLPETRFLVPFDWFSILQISSNNTSGDSLYQVAGDDSTLSGAGGAVALVMFILIGLVILQINCWCVY